MTASSGNRPGKRKGARTARRRPAAKEPDGKRSDHRWTFLSNHAHVLICLARDPAIRLREVATLIGITERSVQNILSDLEAEGFIRRYREGRRNTYDLQLDRPFRHPIEKHRRVRDLVDLILG